MKKITFLSVIVLITLLLSYCAPAPTQEVKEVVKTVVVTEIVKEPGQEKIVEKIVTATPIAANLPQIPAANLPQRGGVVTISVQSPPKTLDPQKVQSQEDFIATFHLFSALTRIGPDFSAQPELAKSWEASADGMTWTFHLFENATFHSGRAVTADDVKFSLERTLNAEECPRGYSTIGPIEKVEAQDEHTVIIKLSKPYLDLPVDLGGIYPRVVNKDTLKDINTKPDGSGPFKFKSWQPGGTVVLSRNENYFMLGVDGKPLPYLDEIRIVGIEDAQSEFAALQSGATDVMQNISYDLLDIAQQDPNITVDGVPSGYHSFNLHLNPTFTKNASEVNQFKDKRVRQAFAYIIDREAALKIAVGGRGQIGNDQPVPPFHLYGNPDLLPKTQDIGKAKALLAEAGVQPGTHYTLYTTAGRPGLKELAIAFQEMAKQADIVIDVEVVDISRYFADLEYKGPFYMDTWDNRQTINATLKQFYITNGSNNCTGLSNPELDKLLEDAESEANFAKRKELYWKAMAIISDEAVTIIPYFKYYFVAFRKDIMNVSAHPMTYMWLDTAWRSK